VYIHSWQEFQDAAESLYSKSPNNVCWIAKIRKKDLTNLGLDSILCKMEIIRREIGLENHRQHDSMPRIEFICAITKPFPNSVSSSKRTRLSFLIDSSLSICHSCKKCKTNNDEKRRQSQHRQRKFSHQSKLAVPVLHPPNH